MCVFWTPDRLEKVRRLHNARCGDCEIAVRVGATAWAIGLRRRKMNLPAMLEAGKRTWTAEDDADLIAQAKPGADIKAYAASQSRSADCAIRHLSEILGIPIDQVARSLTYGPDPHPPKTAPKRTGADPLAEPESERQEALLRMIRRGWPPDSISAALGFDRDEIADALSQVRPTPISMPHPLAVTVETAVGWLRSTGFGVHREGGCWRADHRRIPDEALAQFTSRRRVQRGLAPFLIADPVPKAPPPPPEKRLDRLVFGAAASGAVLIDFPEPLHADAEMERLLPMPNRASLLGIGG